MTSKFDNEFVIEYFNEIHVGFFSALANLVSCSDENPHQSRMSSMRTSFLQPGADCSPVLNANHVPDFVLLMLSCLPPPARRLRELTGGGVCRNHDR